MTKERLDYLLDKHHRDALTTSENEELDLWYQEMQAVNPAMVNDSDPFEEKKFKEMMSADIMERLDKAEGTGRRSLQRRLVLRWAVAASILVITGLFFFNKANTKRLDKIARSPVALPLHKADTISNTTDSELLHYLPDSTEVLLAANSRIVIDDTYNDRRRDVALSGKAFFKVRKDRLKPFTVCSHQIATTALGTAFSVTAYDGGAQVNVSLHEGKVKVQAVNGTVNENRPVFLEAGHQVNFNTATMIASAVLPIEETTRTETASLAVKKLRKINKTSSFEQEPLKNVFDKLAGNYNVRITYNANDIRDLDFSGVIRYDDQILNVLRRICLLNNLTVKESTGGYVIAHQ